MTINKDYVEWVRERLCEAKREEECELFNEFLKEVVGNRIIEDEKVIVKALLEPRELNLNVQINDQDTTWINLIDFLLEKYRDLKDSKNVEREKDKKKMLEEYWEGWIELLQWIVEEGILDKVIDESRAFPVFTKYFDLVLDGKEKFSAEHRSHAYIKLNDVNSETIIIPFKQIFRNVHKKDVEKEQKLDLYENIYPPWRIMSTRYFRRSSILETDEHVKGFIDKLSRYKAFIVKLPNEYNERSLEIEKLKAILVDVEELKEPKKHLLRISNGLLFTDIPFWDDVIGRLRSDVELAKRFIEFLLEYLIEHDKNI